MRKNTLIKLHEDHKNFLKLLSFLEEQRLLLKDCKHTDLSSIVDAIRYMKEYPDFIHHPLEDIIFKYFLENHKDACEEINRLIHEHEEMPQLTEKLLEMLQSALADIPQSRDDLCASLKEYITIQKEHMNQEEAFVYPILNSKLNNKDWKKIDTELAHVEDPLFGTKIEEGYQRLLAQIIS